MKGKRVSAIYIDPLPYSLGPLPNLVLHNPLSIAHFLWAYFFGNHPKQVKISAQLYEQDGHNVSCKVSDPEMMNRLWSMGFFGKGTLSRSEPSWFGRTARRLGLDGGELSFEEITELRRKKRREFKKQRSLQEQRELQESLKREGKAYTEVQEDSDSDQEIPILPQERALVIPDPTKLEGQTIKKMEELELMPCEAVYLSIGLGVLDVYSQQQLLGTRELIKQFCSSNKLFLNYVVYHYLRSLGWCVRSGVKFGTDFIVYKQGPPFQHANFAVMVLHAGHDEQRDWWWSQAVSRVVGAVRKSLVFCYVSGPDPADLELDRVTSVHQFRKLLQQYSVQSVIYSRWAPTKTRD